MTEYKRVSGWLKLREDENGNQFFNHNGNRYEFDEVVNVDNPYYGIGRTGIPEYIKGTLVDNPRFYYVELAEKETGWKVRLYIGVEKPDPTFGEYTLVDYSDVWGNANDGWEVNNQWVEADDLWISDDATEKEILEYLVDFGFLATSDRRKVGIDMSDDFMMEIYAKKGRMPLGRLQMNV